MRPEPNIIVDKYRASHPAYPDTEFGESCGYFVIEKFNPATMRNERLTIISSGKLWKKGEWEHVSVSVYNRCPTWEEMCFVKRLFWDDEETVIQFHPPASKYVNRHEFCLHLWKQIGVTVETPPTNLIG